MCTPRGNVVLLAVIFVLFGGFAVSEMVAALLFNSLSLLGDAMSMVVDSATYLLNMVAEHKKAKGASKRTILKLELYVPLVSVLALLGTSIYVLVQAFQTIANPPVGESGVDTVMLVFAVFNLVIDFVSMFCFARVNKLLGYNVKEEDAVQGDSNHLDRLESPPIQQNVSATDEIAIEDVSSSPGASTSVARLDAGLASRISSDAEQEGASGANPSDSQVNTNMCSAYTHVLADTLRSFAVLIAAVASLCIASINPQLADAWAAVAVSATIFLVVVPLLQGISRKVKQLRTTTDEDEGTTV